MGTQITGRAKPGARTPQQCNGTRLADRAFEKAVAMHRAGRLATADRIAFAWGWAEGYRAAQRQLAAERDR
jgi:hypothetical protein